MVDVDHRVRGASLLREVDDRVGALLLEHAGDEIIAPEVAPVEGELLAEELVHEALALSERRDGGGRPAADLSDPATGDEVVDADDVVPPGQ